MKEFIQAFLNEVNDLIDKIEVNLFELEKNKDNKDKIDEIFRGMHSIKGTAAMYGYKKTGHLTHLIENIYDAVRHNEVDLNKEIISQSFKAIDILRCLLKSEEKECVEEYEILCNKLEPLGSQDKNNENSNETDSIRDTDSYKLFYIILTPDEQVFYRGINPLHVQDELRDLGIFKLREHDGGVPLDKQIEDKICTSRWEFYVVGDIDVEDIEDIFLFFEESEYVIGELVIEQMQHDAAFLKAIKKIYGRIEDFNFEEIIQFYEENIQQEEIQKETIQQEGVGEPSETGQETITSLEQVKEDKGIFVSSSKLDLMMNLVSELVTNNARLEVLAEGFKSTQLDEVSENIHRLSKQFRDNALSMRLVPVKILHQQFKRLVRDLSDQLHKEVEFIMEGMDTELDKTIIKALENPLLHIIRNSIDHGIEPPEERVKNNKSRKGLLRIMSYYSGSQVVIQVHDDGQGINLTKVKEAALKQGYIEPGQNVTKKELLDIITSSGFTTSDKVSMVSGRGVGMDVVSNEISLVGGSLDIDTEAGLGTIITLNIPVTLSIIDTLLVKVDDYQFLIPVTDIVQCITEWNDVLAQKEIKQIEFNKENIPFINIRDLFDINSEPPEEHKIIIVDRNNVQFAILVDHIVGDHQAVLKPLGRVFRSKEYLSGASILGDGSLSYVLDTVKLLNYAHTKNLVNQE
ncbi:MAG: chemotaxis protein CheA [Bacteroidales bacterium]|nr:chemotaxis protein CheA [Bacteroidales bacterium]